MVPFPSRLHLKSWILHFLLDNNLASKHIISHQPKKLLGMYLPHHDSCRVKNCAVLSFCNSILLWSIWCCYPMIDSMCFAELFKHIWYIIASSIWSQYLQILSTLFLLYLFLLALVSRYVFRHSSFSICIRNIADPTSFSWSIAEKLITSSTLGLDRHS